MPILAIKAMNPKYAIVVNAILIGMAKEKETPFLSKIGRDMNNTKEGMIIQIIPLESALTFSTSLVSTYKKMNARSDVSGNEANTAAKVEERLAISETATITTAEITILRMN